MAAAETQKPAMDMAMPARQARGKQALESNMPILSDDEVMLAASLVGIGQAHLFDCWPAPGVQDNNKHRMLKQVAQMDEHYPGGLRSYVLNARELLLKSKNNISSMHNMAPETPSGHRLTPGSREMLEAERHGYAVMHSCAFVLVAGGLGERLGYGGIKVALPAEITTGKCFLQHYINNILALQSACDMSPGQLLPLIIMTSHDTHTKTFDLLARNDHFGADPSQIFLVQQQEVAAFVDQDAHLALCPDDPFQVLAKPHGHGDVHRVLYLHGIAQRLVEQGYQWLYFFQDTNALAFQPLPACLGLSSQLKLDVSTMAVPRKPGDACGALVKLRRPDGTHLVNNVEYNEVQALLSGQPDPVDETTGFSLFPGNTNQILVKLSTYLACLGETKGIVPEFVNPKYADATRTAMLTPARLECMMQDFPKLLSDPTAKVSFIQLDRWISYSPVKNSAKQGAVLAEQGLPPMTPSTGEFDLYASNRKLLRLAGVEVADAPPATFNGVAITPGPRIVLAPSFALGTGDVLHKVKGGRISARSTLIISGPDVRITNLQLDGTLIIRAVPGATVEIKDLVVTNRGWAMEPLKGGGLRAPEELRVRGYQLVKYEQRVIEFTAPGEFVCNK